MKVSEAYIAEIKGFPVQGENLQPVQCIPTYHESALPEMSCGWG